MMEKIITDWVAMSNRAIISSIGVWYLLLGPETAMIKLSDV